MSALEPEGLIKTNALRIQPGGKKKVPFTYDGWKEHGIMVKNELKHTTHKHDRNILEPNPKEKAKVLLNGMKRLQHVHDRKVDHEQIFLLLQRDEKTFTYPNFEEDRQKALVSYLKFEEKKADELFHMMSRKQVSFNGEKPSHQILNSSPATKRDPIKDMVASPSSDSPRDVMHSFGKNDQHKNIDAQDILATSNIRSDHPSSREESIRKMSPTTTAAHAAGSSARETRRRIEKQLINIHTGMDVAVGNTESNDKPNQHIHRNRQKIKLKNETKLSLRENLRRIERLRSDKKMHHIRKLDGIKTNGNDYRSRSKMSEKQNIKKNPRGGRVIQTDEDELPIGDGDKSNTKQPLTRGDNLKTDADVFLDTDNQAEQYPTDFVTNYPGATLCEDSDSSQPCYICMN